MKITSVIITPMPRPMPEGMFDSMPEVIATFENGSSKALFTFYPDEISFQASEFVGLTEEEAHSLFQQKNTAHLRESKPNPSPHEATRHGFTSVAGKAFLAPAHRNPLLSRFAAGNPPILPKNNQRKITQHLNLSPFLTFSISDPSLPILPHTIFVLMNTLCVVHLPAPPPPRNRWWKRRSSKTGRATARERACRCLLLLQWPRSLQRPSSGLRLGNRRLQLERPKSQR